MPGRAFLAAAATLAAVLAIFASPALAAPGGRSTKHVCGPVNKNFSRCTAIVVTNSSSDQPLATSGPTGYNPPDLLSAYALASAAAGSGSGQTVAIVDAYDDPNAESDLGVYRSQFGFSPCTTANGCFRKVNQTGGTTYPNGNSGWAQEISLDLDMVSAICPNCHILLVEATSNSDANLYAAENEAATLGATEISNSWSGGEYSGESSDSSTYFDHPGIAITAASGDSGYAAGTQFPASSQYVTAVGGTTLSKASGTTRGWSETAWSGAGSGCSAFITKPSWQQDPDCSTRSVSDESAVADPNTGVSVYDTYPSGGWLVFGGTSVAAPIIASFDALIGSSASSPQWAYQHTNAFNDVTAGSNNVGGSPCSDYLCNAGPGYDGPTGLGTPNGAGVTLPPTASTGGASNLGISTATIAGTVNPNGYAAGYRFDYGTTTAYGTSTAVGDAGAGTTDVPVSAHLSGLTANTTYHYRVVAVRGGSVAATGSDHTFTTQPPPTPPGSAGGGTDIGTPGSAGGATTVGTSIGTIAGTVNANLAPPRVSGLKVSPKAFGALNSGRSIVTKGKKGTQVTFTLSEKATVTFTVERAQVGRFVGGRCQKQTPKSREAKACTFYVAVRDSFIWRGTPSGNKFRFTGRINGKKLARGTYRLVAVARGASDNLAPPVRVTFTIN